MKKTPEQTSAELESYCDNLYDVASSAHDLRKRIEKLPFENHGIAEPVQRVRNLQNAALSLLELSRAIVGRLTLAEQKSTFETKIGARIKEGT